MIDHELRNSLNDELHGRPGQPVESPSRITHLAFTLGPGDPDPVLAVAKLCDAIGVKSPPPDASHHAVEIDRGLFKYERHGEFYRISVTATGNGSSPEAIALLPGGWVDILPGKRLVGIHTHILPSAKMPSAAVLDRLFGHQEVASSRTNQGKATVWTDFRIGRDGYTRILIHENGLPPMRLGRLARRLHEIETYRMMALLAFPLARQLQAELGVLETALGMMVDKMLSAQAPEEDAQLLNRLTGISREVEEISNRSSYRFAAARAYAALVDKRLAELNEERVQNFQRLGVFLERRFSPAMTTCRAVTERIGGLAERCERASNLLRTRVDIALEGQNQRLLQSMEARTRQQLMLQQTVEGLSVVAISYYSIAIFGKLTESLADFLPALDVKLVTLASIPVIIILVWWMVRRVRKRVYRAAPPQA